jgi:hypothetical protein
MKLEALRVQSLARVGRGDEARRALAFFGNVSQF